MKYLALLFLSLLTFNSYGKIKVAVIDTGIPKGSVIQICATVDFTKTGIEDQHGHGTNVSRLIEQHAEPADYCQIPLKYYNNGSEPSEVQGERMYKALLLVKYLKVDLVNISGGGKKFSFRECKVVKEIIDSGITVVAAAGNESSKGEFYPAMCDRRVHVVSCTNLDVANQNSFVDFKYPCVNVGIPAMSGTSQATAIHTGKLINLMNKRREK